MRITVVGDRNETYPHSDGAGVEGIELPGHPFFLATLFQPQWGSAESTTLHPLIQAFLDAARA